MIESDSEEVTCCSWLEKDSICYGNTHGQVFTLDVLEGTKSELSLPLLNSIYGSSVSKYAVAFHGIEEDKERVTLWSPKEEEYMPIFTTKDHEIQEIQWGLDFNLFALTNNSVLELDIRKPGTPISYITDDGSHPTCMSVNPDSQDLAVAFENKSVRVYSCSPTPVLEGTHIDSDNVIGLHWTRLNRSVGGWTLVTVRDFDTDTLKF